MLQFLRDIGVWIMCLKEFFNSINNLKNYFPYIFASAGFVFVTLAYLFTNSQIINSNVILILVYIDSMLWSIVAYFLFKRVRGIFYLKPLKREKRGFHRQVIMLFSGVAIVPSILVFAFSMLFFNIGIENLFKSPIKNVITNAESVADIYINDIKITVENFTMGISNQISECIDGILYDKQKIEQILNTETLETKADGIVFQINEDDSTTLIASTHFSLSINFEKLPKELSLLKEGQAMAWESGDRVIGASAISKQLGIYLLISTPINDVILDHKYNIKKAIEEYSNLASKRTGLKISFITFFSTITAILLLLSILVGGIFANRILKPINKLIISTKNISSGNYDTPINPDGIKGEFKILITTFNDMISKLEQQKQQLIISNRQNAWRDIARKIAHEIKNPLTPIQLSAERLKNKYKNEITTKPEIFNSCIDTIIRQVQCIGNLVKEFSDFARMPAPKIEKVDIIALIKEVVFIQSNAHKNICFHQSYDRNTCICEIDQAQVNQVLMNLIQNAVNSLVENREENKDNILGNIAIEFYIADGTVNLIIEDDGPGFTETALEKAFDPYYTTREKGTGLGLAIVQKIILDHLGEISIGKSEIFKGAKIMIKLPVNFNLKNKDQYGI